MQGLGGGAPSIRTPFGRPLGSPASSGGFSAFTASGTLGDTGIDGGAPSIRPPFGRPLGSPAPTGGFSCFTTSGTLGSTSIDGGHPSIRTPFGRPLGSPTPTGGFSAFTSSGTLGSTSMAGETSKHYDCHQQLSLLAPLPESAPPVAQPSQAPAMLFPPSLPMHDHFCSGSGL